MLQICYHNWDCEKKPDFILMIETIDFMIKEKSETRTPRPPRGAGETKKRSRSLLFKPSPTHSRHKQSVQTLRLSVCRIQRIFDADGPPSSFVKTAAAAASTDDVMAISCCSSSSSSAYCCVE
jgi:hypothetical protein